MAHVSVSTVLFYCANVLLVTAYVVIGALSFLPGGITGKVQQSKLQRNLGVTFFGAGAVLHLDLAAHVLFLEPFFDPIGKIAWDLTVIVCAQMLAVLVSLYLIRRERRAQRIERL